MKYLPLMLLFILSCTYVEPEDPNPGPHQTLLSIVRMTQRNNYEGLEDFMYGIEFGKNENSKDFLVDGIIGKKPIGNFSYSIDGYLHIVYDFPEYFENGEKELIQDFFLDDNAIFLPFEDLKTIALNEPERIWSWQRGDVIIIFIEDEGIYKILFSKEVGRLKRRPQP
jgi:hypothetical protein